MTSLDRYPVLTDQTLAEISHQQVIDVAFERIDLAAWLFSMPSAEYVRCCEPDHIAYGVSTTDDGRPVSLLVEKVGEDLLVQQYVAQIHRPECCELVAVADVFLASGTRTSAKLTWTMSVAAVDDLRSLYTNAFVARPTDAFLQYIELAGIPFAMAAAAFQAAGDDHARRETPAFAASIQRHAAGR